MASNLFKPHIQTSKIHNSSLTFSLSKIQTHALNFFPKHPHTVSLETFLPRKHLNIPKHPPKFTIHSSSSNSSSLTPPTSKENAILQAKTTLSTALQKPLNNPKLTGRIKKQKQPRFRVEIPLTDDSPESLTQLAFDVFGELPIKRKGSPAKVLLIWPNSATLASGVKAFEAAAFGVIDHVELTTVMTVNNNRILNSADVAIFLAPNSSQLAVLKLVSDSLYPTPVVLFNPKWAFEDEGEFGDLRGFVGSFEVVYAFLGLEVRGILSKRKGVVFKCVRDGVVSGELWNVFVEDEGKTEQLKVVSRFKSRPSIVEVENVLYNLMAVNSPITKSAKFFKDLVSNVTGKKSS